jgi:hypothetical protein
MKTLIRVRIEMVNTKHEDLGIKPDEIYVYQYIDVNEIESIGEYPDDDEKLSKTGIVMKSGHEMLSIDKMGVVVEKLRKLTTIVFC